MANYAVQLNRTASTTASLGTWVADATRPRRLEIFDLIFGSEAAPADNAFLWLLQRCTAPGTNTPVTPQPLDPADAATESDSGELNTVEPTYTANAVMLAIPANQRATIRWQAVRDDCRITTPATASNGVGIQTPTASAVAISATVHANER
jgi:hypothetical protein